MNADEFIAWAAEQPAGRRYELVAGQVFAMAPERAAHARIKGSLYMHLRRAISSARIACEAFPDGMAVRVDDATLYEPDVLVRCGAPVDGSAIEIDDPMIVVEVIAPSCYKRDSGVKLEDYFRIPSVRHYLIVKTENQAIIHHQRNDAGQILTNIIRDGVVHLDPPGLVVTGLFDP